MTKIPEAYAHGDQGHFSWNSAWWAFNFVSNYINLKYSYMIKDVQKVQKKLESEALIRQDSVEQVALKAFQQNKTEGIKVLENYCMQTANHVVDEWRELGQFLITKYIDGYINDEKGPEQSVGYPQDWYNKAVQDNPSLIIPGWGNDTKKTEEPESY